MSDFNREIAHLVTRLERTKKMAMREVLMRFDLKMWQSICLAYIERNPGTKQENIADWYFVDKGTVARNAIRLEDKGYIRRETDPEDRRGYRLYLTETGKNALDEIIAAHKAWSVRLAGSLSEDEQRQTVELMSRMAANFDIM